MPTRIQGKWQFFFLLVGMQTGASMMEITVDVSQETEKRSAIRFSYISLEHIPEGLYV